MFLERMEYLTVYIQNIYFLYMETVIFKIDKKLKTAIQKRAKADGISVTDVFKLAGKAYASGNSNVEMVSIPRLNEKTRNELIRISKDIKEGKNLVGPFNTVKEMKKYLES